ncbi:hypothetical protein NBRC116589_44130 [Ruegeria sp. HU-ET01832]
MLKSGAAAVKADSNSHLSTEAGTKDSGRPNSVWDACFMAFFTKDNKIPALRAAQS